MNTHVSEADLNRDSSNPLEAFAPMTEDKMQEFHHALDAGVDPVFQAEERATRGRQLVICQGGEPLTKEEQLWAKEIGIVVELQLKDREFVIGILTSDDDGTQVADLQKRMRVVAIKQLETDPDGDGPPVVEQVIRAAYQDENPPKETLKKLLQAAREPASTVLKEIAVNAREVRVPDDAQAAYIHSLVAAASLHPGTVEVINPQFARRHPEWACTVLDGLDILERDYPDLAFFYTLAIFTGATALDLADLFDTPLALVLDEMDEAHATLLRIIGERARVGVPL